MQDTRRVRMTKKMIKEAYIELLEVNPYKRLSITDICKVADINRSTFYMHYEDVDALVREIEDELLDFIPYPKDDSSELSDRSQFVVLLEKTFEYIYQNKRYFSIVFVHFENANFKQRIAENILEKYKTIVISSNTLLKRYGFVFCINGVIGLIKEWIIDDFPLSCRQLAEIVLHMCAQATNFKK